MRLKKVRKILGTGIIYKVGVDGDYLGEFTKTQLKRFDDLNIIGIWLIDNIPGYICLDLYRGGEDHDKCKI